MNFKLKIFLTFIFGIFNILTALSQNNDTLTYKIFYKNCDFYFNNKEVIPLTGFYKQMGGLFYFHEGCFDSIYSKESQFTCGWVLPEGKRKGQGIPFKEIFIDKSNNSIDTIKNYFPSSFLKSDTLRLWYYESFYFLQQLKEPVISNHPDSQAIRILYPSKWGKFHPICFSSVRIHIYGDSARVYYKEGCYKEGLFNVTGMNTSLMKKGKLKLLKKYIHEMEFSGENIFFKGKDDGYPWLFEYKNRDKYYKLYCSMYTYENIEYLRPFRKCSDFMKSLKK
ncbi:MAG: hypothetical protein KAT68_13990 [Bacteroidales bacterium]|nr:hypothetical protein [Bacteroidales bacterium]